MVDAFFRATRGGDFDGLVALLDPEVVLRSDYGGRRPAAPKVIHGAAAVARQAQLGALPGAELHPALVNGTAGMVITVHGRPFAVMGFTVVDGKIIEIDAIADPERVGRIADGCSQQGIAAANPVPPARFTEITPERDPRWLSWSQRPVRPHG